MDVVYYAASSLDGYIATAEGGVEWLRPFEEAGEDHGFSLFYGTIDGLVMGSRTYEFALRHEPWLAPDKPTWVFTSRDLPRAHPSVTLTADEPLAAIRGIREQGLGRLWLVGGGELAASFRRAGLITHYMVSVVPVVLGEGVPLVAPGPRLDGLHLTEVRPYPSGIVSLSYESRA